MKKSMLFLGVITLCAMMVTGFQCSSTELTSARLYMQRSEWANAEKSLEDEVKKSPSNAEAWYLLGQVRDKLKKYAPMNDAFTHSLAASNQYEKEISDFRLSVWGLLFNKGVEEYLRGREANQDSARMYFLKSIDNFKTAVVINPDSGSTYMNLGLTYFAVDDYDNGIRNLEMAMEKDKSAEAAFAVGGKYLERARKSKNNAESATGDTKTALQADSKQHFDKAIATLEKARQWDPNNQNVMGLLLDAYIAAGRIDDAMINFKRAVEKNPNNKLFRYNYGVLLLKANDYKEAVEQFNAAMVTDPSFEDALYNLGIAYLQWGAKARAATEESARTDGKNKPVDKSYEEQFRLSKDNLERLRDIKPEDPDVLEALGQAYANLNMKKKAEEAFIKSDELRKKK